MERDCKKRPSDDVRVGKRTIIYRHREIIIEKKVEVDSTWRKFIACPFPAHQLLNPSEYAAFQLAGRQRRCDLNYAIVKWRLDRWTDGFREINRRNRLNRRLLP